MSDDSQNHGELPADEDEYPLLPPEPVHAKPTAPLYGPEPEDVLEPEPPEEEDGFQFSLRELFVVMTAAAVALGIVSSLPEGGRLQGALAIIGVGLFVSLAVLDYLRVKRRLLHIVWFTLFVCYLLIGLLAVAGTF